ncbi:DUF222 domain-containing protein [Pseudonocardia hispaniensis]|uniref:DUF222 domain-containing protein n=1 Tax=Pseudonocardia hispaniensis TaxID=904933 RepID=A0ABW1J652_9PSEU
MAVGEENRAGVAELTPGPELAAALHELDLAAVPNTEVVDVLRSAWRQVSHSFSVFLAAMVEVGHAVPVPEGPSAGSTVERRRAAWEWSAAEIAAALTFTGRRAESELAFAQVLVEHLPLVFAALADGEIDHLKARVFADHLCDLTDEQVAVICRRILPGAPRWTTGQLANRLLREVQNIDPDAARRRYQRALRERGVSGYLDADGTARITGHGLPPAEAAAAAERLDQLARSVKAAGHPAPERTLRADLLLRLLDGRYDGFNREQIVAAMLADEATYPPERAVPEPAKPSPRTAPRTGVEIRVGLSTLLGLDEHTAELAGWGSVTAAEARLLVAAQHAAQWRVALLDDNGFLSCATLTRRRPTGLAHPTTAAQGGVVEIHLSTQLLQRLTSGDIVLDEQTAAAWGTLVADIAHRCRAGETDPQRLDARPRDRFVRSALRRYVQMRDRSCVAPGCRWPARKADADHTQDHAHGGETARGNVGPLCAMHHLMKHAGWNLVQPRPGVFRWRSPLGQIYWTGGEPVTPDLPEPVPGDPEPEHPPPP